MEAADEESLPLRFNNPCFEKLGDDLLAYARACKRLKKKRCSVADCDVTDVVLGVPDEFGPLKIVTWPKNYWPEAPHATRRSGQRKKKVKAELDQVVVFQSELQCPKWVPLKIPIGND